ncbi:MAG: tetratricopeptide repeat protein [Anaerolineaceae bacterium]|nr:tetratricopeptide repeat protein [Anaerolineaceae bacterium]
MLEREQIEQAITALEAQRAVMGDAVVDATLTALREKLAQLEPHTPVEQRKLVTILFADTVSSTAMFEHVDPEDVLAIMDGALRAYTDTVGQMEGMVARLMGDGLLAFFGAPVSREDDAFRAVRCGLALVGAARDYAQEVEKRWGVTGFNVRVGINTGLVALGEVGGASGWEYTAMGDAINLAARLESNAPVGSTLISYDTYRHVRGMFEVRTLEPLRVKGKTEPVPVYVVEREKPRTFLVSSRGIDDVETRMIGREAEMKVLQDVLDMALEDNETQMVTILGDAGVGKSRLLREFDHWIDELPDDIWHFTGRATIETQNLPYGLLRDVFSFRFNIQDSDTTATVWEKMEEGVAKFLGTNTEKHAHYIGYLVGFDFSNSPYISTNEAPRITEQALRYLRQFFLVATRDDTVVLFLEDVHWADDKSLDFICEFVQDYRHLPLVVLCLARPTLLERRPYWGEGAENHTLLRLRPLSRRDTRRLVEEILYKTTEIPAKLRSLVVSGADGNPFYVEEFIKMLIDEGVIIKGPEQWHIHTERLADLNVPPTLTGVLQARLDALSPGHRLVLQRASVIGRIFWQDTIANMYIPSENPAPDLENILAALRGYGLILAREQSTFAGTKEYIFKHSILRNVTYESVLKRHRRQYHAQVAEWLIKYSGDRASEYIGRIADHYELAEATSEATDYLTQASQRAFLIGAYQEAVKFGKRGLALVEHEDAAEARQQRTRLYWQIGQAVESCGTSAEARQWYENSLADARELDDPRLLIKPLNSLGWVSHIQGDSEAAEVLFQEALNQARETNYLFGMTFALNGLGLIAAARGEYQQARDLFEECLAIARKLDDKRRINVTLINLGHQAVLAKDYHTAEKYLAESLASSKEMNSPDVAANALSGLGDIAIGREDYDRAQEYLEEASMIARRIGHSRLIAGALVSLGVVAYQTGRYAEATQYLDEALKKAIDVGAVMQTLLILVRIARLLAKQEQAEQSVELLGLVLYHPAVFDEAKQEASDLLKDLEATLSPSLFTAALERGKALDVGAVLETLHVLVRVARIFAKDGQPEQAIELLSLVSHHPASFEDIKQEAEGLLIELRATVTQEMFQGALERGRTLEIEAVVQDILREG